jgi:hypothetical protein
VWECYICDKCSSKIKAYIESLGGRVEVWTYYTYLDLFVSCGENTIVYYLVSI